MTANATAQVIQPPPPPDHVVSPTKGDNRFVIGPIPGDLWTHGHVDEQPIADLQRAAIVDWAGKRFGGGTIGGAK